MLLHLNQMPFFCIEPQSEDIMCVWEFTKCSLWLGVLQCHAPLFLLVYSSWWNFEWSERLGGTADIFLECSLFSKKDLLRQGCLCGSLVMQGRKRAPFHFIICISCLSFFYRSAYKRKSKNKVFAKISDRSNWTEGACSCCFRFHGSW